jgi:putative ABC transport system permease protein
MSKDSDQTSNLSKIDPSVQDKILNKHKEAVGFQFKRGF